MATIQNERDKTLQATDPRLVATSVAISSDNGAVFYKPPDPDPMEPTSMTLTATTTVFTSPVISWQYASDEDMIWHDFLVSGSPLGSSRTISSSTFLTHVGTNGTKVFYKASATQTGFRSAENTFEVAFNDISSGVDGRDAYHIRLDNESRFVLFSYTGDAKPGQLPLTAQLYVTKGPADVTVGSGYVAYAIQSTSGATGVSVSSSGLITVTNITLDVNFVEVKVTISEPDLPVLYGYKKLFIYKQQEASLEIDVNVSQDHVYYEYANATSTTNIAAWSTITFTAEVTGYPGAVVEWSAIVYDNSGAVIPGTETIFTAVGNTCTVSAAQFVARGGYNNVLMKVIATYAVGGSSISDYGVIIRKDGTNGTRFLYTDNYKFTYSADVDGVVSDAQLREETATLAVYDLSTDAIVDDTTGWIFNATGTAGATIDINGSGDGPYTALAGVPVILRLTALAVGVTTGTINVTASKATFPTISVDIDFEVALPASDGYNLTIDPDSTIILPVNASGDIIGYESAFRTIKVMKGTTDDTLNWTLSKTDGPGVTSTLTDGVIQVTNFTAVYGTIDYSGGTIGSITYVTRVNESPLAFNYSGTYLYMTWPATGVATAFVSTDHGATWSSYTMPSLSGAEGVIPTPNKALIYCRSLGKFLFIYGKPSSSGNGRAYVSSTGLSGSWTAVTLPDHSTSNYWQGAFEDRKTGKVYIFDYLGTNVMYSTDLSSWTLVTNSTSVGSNCQMSGYNDVFVKYKNISGAGTKTIYYSTNLTAWTDISSQYGLNECAGMAYNKDGTFYIPANKFGTLNGGYGVQASTGGSPASTWKNVALGTTSGSILNYLFAYTTSTVYYTDSNTAVFTTRDGFSTNYPILLTPTGGNPVTASGSYNRFTGVTVFPVSVEQLPRYSSSYILPVVKINDSGSNKFYRGIITEGNNGTDSYITITATPDDTRLGTLTKTIIVKKGTYTGDIYTLVLFPYEIRLPSTSDGVVYPTSYTGGVNVATYQVLKNGIPYTGAISGAVSTSTGLTVTVGGTGTSTGTLTVTDMTKTATEPGTITGTVSIDAVPGQTMSVSVKVVKLRDGTDSGPVPGAVVSAFTSTETTLTVRFNPSGTVEIQRGAGAYVRVVNWAGVIDTTPAPGNSYYICMDYTSDTGDTLQLGTNGTTTNNNTWGQLNVAREWYLSNAATGTHRVNLTVKIGTSSSGAGAIVGKGTLEILVP